MAHDALSAHARDELGVSDTTTARPIQAALAFRTFAVGAALPLATAFVTPPGALIPVTVGASILSRHSTSPEAVSIATTE